MYKKIAFIFLLFISTQLHAQNDFACDSISIYLDKIEQRVELINTTDPELITLHYLFAIDLENELADFYTNRLTKLSDCENVDHNSIINQYDRLKNSILILKDSLAIQKTKVDQMFYDNAFLELQLKNYQKAIYNINRSLEFKPLQANSLLLKLDILYDMKEYNQALEVLNVLYHEIELTVDQEKRTIDFNMKFYNELYQMGDSLIKIDKATDAFEIFTILETFCNNMPSGYCNDDYYHGILRSKVGVYESYLKIASVAKERGNRQMELKFMEYAQAYLDANSELIEEMKIKQTNATVQNQTNTVNISENSFYSNEYRVTYEPKQDSPTEVKKEAKNIQKPIEPIQKEKPKKEVVSKPKETKKKNVKTPLFINKEDQIDSTMIKYKQYQEVVEEAIDMCIRKEFEQAYDKFIQAEELEQCNCFIKDGRVKLFLEELRKIRKD